MTPPSARIESGDLVAIESTRIPVQKNLNLGVKSGDMWFSGLMKAGHIDIVTGQFSAVAMVTPAIKKGVAFAEFLPLQPARQRHCPSGSRSDHHELPVQDLFRKGAKDRRVSV